MDSFRLWKRFREAFLEEASRKPDVLVTGWQSDPTRTACYADILTRVAERLELTREQGFLDVDFVLMKGDPGVPWVAIESEDDRRDVEYEIAKLCAVAAPLRVLLTVAEWDSAHGGWTHAGTMVTDMTTWSANIRARLGLWPHGGTIGILVGELGMDGRLRYYPYAFNESGELIESGEPETIPPTAAAAPG